MYVQMLIVRIQQTLRVLYLAATAARLSKNRAKLIYVLLIIIYRRRSALI
jgi:hypothetical protein